MTYWYIIIPLVSAFIGWLINKIAISIFFQKLWPKRQPQLARKISGFVIAEFSSLNLEQKIASPANLEKARPVIETHIDDFLRNKLKEQMPMIGMFIGDKTIQSLKEIFMRELETLFPEVMKNFAGNMKNDLGIEEIVMTRINDFSSHKLKAALSKEVRSFELLGAAAGLIIGLVQVALISWFFVR
ncbi:MAG: DUF445 domain-containing protein [Chitinophagaceae bacterium]